MFFWVTHFSFSYNLIEIISWDIALSFKVINFFMSKSFKTFLKHTAKDFHNQSVNPPVVRASTIIFKSMQHIRKTQAKAKKNPTGGHYDYGRQGTSTTHIYKKF
jgi:cystathionine beta-lyase